MSFIIFQFECWTGTSFCPVLSLERDSYANTINLCHGFCFLSPRALPDTLLFLYHNPVSLTIFSAHTLPAYIPRQHLITKSHSRVYFAVFLHHGDDGLISELLGRAPLQVEGGL